VREGKDGEGEGWVRERILWGRGGRGNFFRVEGRVRKH